MFIKEVHKFFTMRDGSLFIVTLPNEVIITFQNVLWSYKVLVVKKKISLALVVKIECKQLEILKRQWEL